MLTLSTANAKTSRLAEKLNIPKSHVMGFSLPAGYTCPGAKDCRSYAKRTGGIVDAPGCKFRCFAANAESQYINTREMVWRNFEAIESARQKGGVRAIARLILKSLEKHPTLEILRVHVHGDFYHRDYMLAWILVARIRKDIRFYSYTKSWHLLRQLAHLLPANYAITYSIGGKWDADAVAANWPNARVFLSEEDASAAGLEVCHDELPALCATKSFALVIHGAQPKGSDAGKAVQRNRKATRLGMTVSELEAELGLPVLEW